MGLNISTRVKYKLERGHPVSLASKTTRKTTEKAVAARMESKAETQAHFQCWGDNTGVQSASSSGVCLGGHAEWSHTPEQTSLHLIMAKGDIPSRKNCILILAIR